MKLRRSWVGTTQAIGATHVPHPPGNGSKAEVATGLAGASAGRQQLPPPLAAWMTDPRRKCRDKPTAWWYAPESEAIEELDEHGRIVVDDEGKAVIVDRIQVSTEEHAKLAAALCGRCPLNLDCADYGLRHEPFGMWGGIKLNGLTGVQRDDRLAGVERERRRRSP